MATKRLTITVDKQLYSRVSRLARDRRPRLPKRYVVELALERLLEAVDQGEIEIGVKEGGKEKK